jgi:hypothetical protein
MLLEPVFVAVVPAVLAKCPVREQQGADRCEPSVTETTNGPRDTCHYDCDHRTERAMKRATAFLGLVAAFVGTTPTRGEQQLPINELYPCEIVLHELIAELTKLQAEAKRELVVALAKGGGPYAARPDATTQTLDKAIKLTTAKYDRCP